MRLGTSSGFIAAGRRAQDLDICQQPHSVCASLLIRYCIPRPAALARSIQKSQHHGEEELRALKSLHCRIESPSEDLVVSRRLMTTKCRSLPMYFQLPGSDAASPRTDACTGISSPSSGHSTVNQQYERSRYLCPNLPVTGVGEELGQHLEICIVLLIETSLDRAVYVNDGYHLCILSA